MYDNEKGRLVGLETELLLVDNQGSVSNKAAKIVNHSENTENIVPEFCTLTQVIAISL